MIDVTGLADVQARPSGELQVRNSWTSRGTEHGHPVALAHCLSEAL